jgi:signal peptidase I
LEDPQGPAIKRVLGLPGDVVVWRGPELWINSRRQDEPWVVHPERSGSGQKACGDGYLVLGDNRPDSQDGRAWGTLPLKALRGRVF